MKQINRLLIRVVRLFFTLLFISVFVCNAYAIAQVIDFRIEEPQPLVYAYDNVPAEVIEESLKFDDFMDNIKSLEEEYKAIDQKFAQLDQSLDSLMQEVDNAEIETKAINPDLEKGLKLSEKDYKLEPVADVNVAENFVEDDVTYEVDIFDHGKEIYQEQDLGIEDASSESKPVQI